MRRSEQMPAIGRIASIAIAILVAVAGCRARPQSRPPQPRAPRPARVERPAALVFTASEEPPGGGKSSLTFYVVHLERDKLTAEPVLTRPGLRVLVALPNRYVVVGAGAKTFIYRVTDDNVTPAKVPTGEMGLHDAKTGRVLLLRQVYSGVENLEVFLFHVASGRLEGWKMPSGLAESPIGKERTLMFKSRMSPDLGRLALFTQAPPSSGATRTTSLVILERGGTGARVLDSGLWPGWWAGSSSSRGPSLVWLDNQRVLYVDVGGGRTGPGYCLIKVANVTTGEVRTLLDSRLGQGCPGWLWRDPITGEIAPAQIDGHKSVLEVAPDGLHAELRKVKAPRRFVTVQSPEDRFTGTLRDTVRGTEIWRGYLPTFSETPSPDASLVAFAVWPKQRHGDPPHDLYVYDGQSGRTHKVFGGYVEGLVYWLGK